MFVFAWFVILKNFTGCVAKAYMTYVVFVCSVCIRFTVSRFGLAGQVPGVGEGGGVL